MPPTWLDYRSVWGRALLYVADAWIIAAGVIVALAVGKHWAWWPFVLGPIIATAGVGANVALLWIAVRAFRPGKDEMPRFKDGLRLRCIATVPGYGAIGLCVGLIAGSVPSYWPDVALPATILLTGILFPLVLLPFLKRKADAARAARSG